MSSGPEPPETVSLPAWPTTVALPDPPMKSIPVPPTGPNTTKPLAEPADLP